MSKKGYTDPTSKNPAHPNLSNPRHLNRKNASKQTTTSYTPKQWLKGLSGEVSDAIILTNRRGEIWMMNQVAMQFFVTDDHLTPTNILGLVKYPNSLYAAVKQILNTGSICEQMHLATPKKELPIKMNCKATAVHDKKGHLAGFRLVLSPASLVENPENKEGQNIAVNAREEERQRIARELHDGISQMLVSNNLRLEAMMSGTVEMDLTQLKNLKTSLTEAIEEVRRVSHHLMPCCLEELGLAEALRDLSNNISSVGNIKIKTSLPNDLSFHQELHLGLYRIIQEFLQNTLRHAAAEEVSIQIENLPGQVKLRLTDDGIGFHPSDTPSGCGLNNIRSRTRSLNGTYALFTAPGKGVCLEVCLPV